MRKGSHVITVGQMREFLENFDSDCAIHFLIESERAYIWEMWRTDLGPMFELRQPKTSEPAAKEVYYDWVTDTFETDPDGAA